MHRPGRQPRRFEVAAAPHRPRFAGDGDTRVPPIKIVVWDNIGNTLLGVRPWASWSPTIKERLLAEDPRAEVHAPSFDRLFADADVALTWLYDPAKLGAGFGDLLDDFAGRTRPLQDSA